MLIDGSPSGMRVSPADERSQVKLCRAETGNVEKVLLAVDATLMEEASKYSTPENRLSIFIGGGDPSSSSLSGGHKAMVAVSHGGGVVSSPCGDGGMTAFCLLREIGADGREGEIFPDLQGRFQVGGNRLLKGGEDEKELEEGEGRDSASRLDRHFLSFCWCIRMPIEGFQREILALLEKIEERK